jgi:acyl-CoA hydrolase
MDVIEKEKNFRKKKPVSFSAVENYRLEWNLFDSPEDSLFLGSKLLNLVSQQAIKVAENHAETKLSGHSIDFVRFHGHVHKGDILYISLSVNKVWTSSLEVGAKLTSDDFRTLEKKNVLTAYFTFDALDEKGEPILIDGVIPETKEQIQRFFSAEKRKSIKEHGLLPKL